MTIEKIKTILDAFSIPKGAFNFNVIHSGYINKTYFIDIKGSPNQKLILQSINTSIFPDVDTLLNNSIYICEHIENKLHSLSLQQAYINLHFYKTADNTPYFKQDNEYYCLLDHIEHKTIDANHVSSALAAEAGKTLGYFHQLTNDLDPDKIAEVIPNFHRLDLRYKKFKSINLADNQRYKETEAFYREVVQFDYLVNQYASILDNKELPIKIVHNDPKLSNILFDKAEKGLTMIDLDTVMPGFLNNDYGDAIRSLTNTSDENELDLKKVDFNFPLFESFTKTYLNVVKDIISNKEKEYMALFTLLITYEQLIRFYGDFLENDVYYQTSYPMHNLQRSKVQLKLLQQMVARFDEMKGVIMSLE